MQQQEPQEADDGRQPQQTYSMGFDVSGGDFSQANFGNGKRVTNIYYKQESFQPPVTMSEGDIILSSSIVLHEKKPICDDTRVFRGTFGNKILGNKEIALKIAKDGELERKEAEFHHSLPEHPNLVRLIHMDAFDYRGKPSIYIAMELCEINLYQYIVTQKDQEVPFDPIKYLSFAKDIARGLSVLHALKKIHRDLKPSNILLIEDCTIAKVSDFGLSKAISGDKTKTTQSRFNAGTDGWKSPEVLRDDTHISTSTDIFSEGIIFAFMWSYGKHPYGSKRHSRNHFILNQPPDLDGILLENPTLAKHLISDMLNPNPKQRPTTDAVLEHEIFSQEDSQLRTEPTRQVRNLTEKKLSLESEAAKLKKANKFEEATTILKDLEKQHEDWLLNTRLELVECNILSKKFEEATKCQKRLAKFVESQDLSPEEVKTKADHCIESKHYIRALMLLYTAGKLVNVKTGEIAEAEFINKVFKEMNEIVCEIIKEDKSKKDIVIDCFLPSLHEFTVEEMTKKGASANFLEKLEQLQDGLVGVYLLTFIEENILGKNNDESEKLRGKLLEFLKLQRIPIKDVTNMGQNCEEERQYIKAYIFYFLAARLAMATMSGTETAEVIHKQMESLGQVADKMMREENSMCDVITDYIVPSTYEFTVTILKEKGKVSEAGYLLKQHKEQTPKLMLVLVELAARKAEEGNFESARPVIEIVVHVSKLQQLTPEYLFDVGKEFRSPGQYAKAYLWYLSATELVISTRNGAEIVKSMKVLHSIISDATNEMLVKDQDVNPIANLIRAFMDKLNSEFKDAKYMTREQTVEAQCWCSLLTACCYGIQNNFQRAIDGFDSLIAVLKSEFGDDSRKYRVLALALHNLAQNHCYLNKKEEAIKVCEDALSAARDAEDWNDEEHRRIRLMGIEELLKDVRGESSIGPSVKKWAAKIHFEISTSSSKTKDDQCTKQSS